MSSSPTASPSPTIMIDPALLESTVSAAVNAVVAPILVDLSQNTPLPKSKKRRTKADNDHEGKQAMGYYDFGRQYLRQADLFLPIDKIVNFGIKYETEDTDDEEEHSELCELEKRYLICWNKFCGMIPNFKLDMLKFAADPRRRKSICKEIALGRSKARSDDTSSLNHEILVFIPVDAPNTSISPALTASMPKTLRGWAHPETAKQNSPIRYPATPETYDKIRRGELAMTSAMLPRFLYPEDHEYDPSDVLKDVLRGHILERACRHIYLGPSTALKTTKTNCGKAGNAAIAGLTSMTPEMVAYAAVQVRYTLSSASSWDAIDGRFSYSDFFTRIVGLFDDVEDRKSHVEHFNCVAFGSSKGLASAPTPVDDEIDDYEIAKQQRALKRARAVDEAAAEGNGNDGTTG